HGAGLGQDHGAAGGSRGQGVVADLDPGHRGQAFLRGALGQPDGGESEGEQGGKGGAIDPGHGVVSVQRGPAGANRPSPFSTTWRLVTSRSGVSRSRRRRNLPSDETSKPEEVPGISKSAPTASRGF